MSVERPLATVRYVGQATEFPRYSETVGKLSLKLQAAFDEVEKTGLLESMSNFLAAHAGTNLLKNKGIVGSVKGLLFAQLAFQTLATSLDEKPQFLLSPDETFALFKALHPRRELIGTGQFATIHGLRIPDGVEITEGEDGQVRISGFLEYSTSRDKRSRGGITAKMNRMREYTESKDVRGKFASRIINLNPASFSPEVYDFVSRAKGYVDEVGFSIVTPSDVIYQPLPRTSQILMPITSEQVREITRAFIVDSTPRIGKRKSEPLVPGQIRSVT